MSSNEVIRMAYELMPDLMPSTPEGLAMFADIVASAEREKVAKWMIEKGYATGHGDTVEDLLKELESQVLEREREEIAVWFGDIEVRLDGKWVSYAAAIRARGNK